MWRKRGRRRRRREYLLERRRIRRPLRHIFVKRVAMESKIIPPVVDLFLIHIKTCRKSHCL